MGGALGPPAPRDRETRGHPHLRPFQAVSVAGALLGELEVGATYVGFNGGSSTGTATDGLYTHGTYTPGTEARSLTLEG